MGSHVAIFKCIYTMVLSHKTLNGAYQNNAYSLIFHKMAIPSTLLAHSDQGLPKNKDGLFSKDSAILVYQSDIADCLTSRSVVSATPAL